MFGRRKQELSLRIDKPADQPGTGDAVDLRPLARDPALWTRRSFFAARQVEFGPTRNPAFEIPGVNIASAESRGDPLTDLMPVHAVDDDRTVPR